MKTLLTRLSAEHFMSLLISNHYGEIGLKGAPLLRISSIIEQTNRLAPMGDDQTRVLWVDALGDDGRTYWFRFRTWVYQDLYGLDILEERHMSITCLTNKETFEKPVNIDFYDKFLALALADLTDLVDAICKAPAAYNKYVEKNLPKQLRHGRIQRERLAELVPAYKLNIAEPGVARQALIALIGGRTPCVKKMTIREYCKWYRIAYNAFHGHKESEEELRQYSDTEFYDRHSSCCMRAIESNQYDVDSEADYLEFAQGHYGEIGLSRCCIHGREFAPNQWKISVDNSYINLTEKVLDIIAALYKAGAPLYEYNPASYLAILDGNDYFAIKPDTYHDYGSSNDNCSGSLSLPYPDEIYEDDTDPNTVWTQERLNAVIAATRWTPLQKVKKNSPA